MASQPVEPDTSINTSVNTNIKASVKNRPLSPFSSKKDVQAFADSSTCDKLIETIQHLGQTIDGLRTSKLSPIEDCGNIHLIRLVSLLRDLREWIQEIPPDVHNMRFGNPAFRRWKKRQEEETYTCLSNALSDVDLTNNPYFTALPELVEELLLYFNDSFGNATRLDYGSGHELNFFGFMYILIAVGVFSVPADGPHLILGLFNEYLSLARALQSTYSLEPAGSRGAWGLDDYQFLPFVWGAYQLKSLENEISPKDAINEAVVKEQHKDFLYLGAINVILETKRGAPFAETSPTLYALSSSAMSWAKLSSGFIKMFRAEVLSSFPIMQHFPLSRVISINKASPETTSPTH